MSFNYKIIGCLFILLRQYQIVYGTKHVEHDPEWNILKEEKDMTSELYKSHKHILKDDIRYDPVTGFPMAFYNLKYKADGDSPTDISDNFIRQHKKILGLESDDDLNDLYQYRIQETPAGYTVRYQQRYQGIPVHESDLAITINKKSEVTFVMSSYKQGVQLHNDIIEPLYNAKEIIVKTGNKIDEDLLYHDTKLTIVYQHGGYSNLAWKLDVQNNEDFIEKEILVDANNGHLIRIREKFADAKSKNDMIRKPSNKRPKDKDSKSHNTIHKENKNASIRSSKLKYRRKTQAQDNNPSLIQSVFNIVETITDGIRGIFRGILEALFPSMSATPIPSSAPTISLTPTGIVSNGPTLNPSKSVAPSVDRTLNRGFVFDPDPITTAGATYGRAGFRDNDDRDSDELNAQVKDVVLNDIQFQDGLYRLKGPWVKIVDIEPPKRGLFIQESPNFYFKRSESGFEAVNCYYHIDKIMRYINHDLGIPVRPYRYEGGIRVDPHGFSGEDNSHYVIATQELAFGEGGVDDAEDPDVIVHELAHGLHDWLTGGSISLVEGLSEGFGDYIAATYSRKNSEKYLSKDDPKLNWVMRWDGHNNFWAGRITNYDAKYPKGLKGKIHIDGQIWSSCNMRIWEKIGKEKSDKIHLIGMSMTSLFANQLDAAHAALQAAINLEYSEEDIDIIKNTYISCGYDLTGDVCGDGVVGILEECDGGDVGDATCENQSCSLGKPSCSSTCELDYSSCLPNNDESNYEIQFTPDHYGNENSWEITNSNGIVVDFAGPFLDKGTHQTTGCFQKDACLTFKLYDRFSDGICCNYGNGNYDIFVDGVEIQGTDPKFSAQFVTHYIGNCAA